MADAPGFNWKGLVMGFSTGHFLFNIYLDYRQYKFLKTDKPSPELKDVLDTETFEKTQKYQLAKQQFSLFSSVYSFTQNILFTQFNALPKLYYVVEGFLASVGPKYAVTRWLFGAGGPTPTSVLTFLVLNVIHAVLNLPISYYSTFVLEEKFGFNKETKSIFIKDFLKSQFLSFAIGTPVMIGFIKIINYFGDKFFVYIWSAFFVFQIVMMTIAPILIMPLFNKFTPLEDGSLKTKIENLAKSLSFPLSKLFVVDGSTRSSHSNAYFTGLPWSKRIVLFDTLIEHSSEDEIVAILGHEIGHWALSHLTKTLVMIQANISLMFFSFGAFFRNISFYESFGFKFDHTLAARSQLPILVGFMLFLDILTPLEFATTFLSNLLSRKHEYEADEYATNLGMGEELASGLKKLFKENLSSAGADPLYSAYHHSHPLLPDRLKAIKVNIAARELEAKKEK